MSTIHKSLIVIAPTASPNICGVSDYSHHTAQGLTKAYKSVSLGLEKTPNSIRPHDTANIPFYSWKKIISEATKTKVPTDIILNYTPASYSVFGCPLNLISALYKFKNAHPENRLFLFVHETWNGSKDLRMHHTVRDKFTKWSILKLSKIANGIAAVTQDQKVKINTLVSEREIHLSPIGANILPNHKEDGLTSIRRDGIWVVFGLAHTRLWTLQAHLPFIKALYSKGILKQLRAIGPTDNAYAKQEADLITENLGSNVLLQLGSLKPNEISHEFCISTAALVGQTPSNLHKSGSFAALSAHAVPVICEVPDSLLDPPGTSFFSPAEVLENPGILASEVGDIRRRNLHKWFWETRSWEAISRDISEWMGIVENQVKK